MFPLARRYAHPHAAFTTLLMSAGLTFGTISATYGYTAGIITKAQFSVLVTVVVLATGVPAACGERGAGQEDAEADAAGSPEVPASWSQQAGPA